MRPLRTAGLENRCSAFLSLPWEYISQLRRNRITIPELSILFLYCRILCLLVTNSLIIAMPSRQVFQLHPFGWESDPDEERFKVSIIDRTPVTSYTQYVVYFRVDDADKDHAVDVLKAGLEKTLSQAKYFCATIESDPEGGQSFVKKKETTVDFILRRLDLPGDEYPLLDEIEAAYFSARSQGDVNIWGQSSLLHSHLCSIDQFPQ